MPRHFSKKSRNLAGSIGVCGPRLPSSLLSRLLPGRDQQWQSLSKLLSLPQEWGRILELLCAGRNTWPCQHLGNWAETIPFRPDLEPRAISTEWTAIWDRDKTPGKELRHGQEHYLWLPETLQAATRAAKSVRHSTLVGRIA